MTQRSQVVCLMGPTGAGKSDYAMHLAVKLNAEIVSVDSVLVYRGMAIGAAKPTRAMREQVPHHLMDICDPSESYSAERFRQDAIAAIESIVQRGRIPLLVGGTMLYFRALQFGLSSLPAADAKIRLRLQTERERYGVGKLYQRLKQIDPKRAQDIDPNDWQRIQRALEIYEITGEPMSQLFNEKPIEPAPYEFQNLALIPEDRSTLYQKLADRFHDMLSRGLVEEVRQFYQRNDLHRDLPALRAVGYRQVWDYLEGRLTYDAMVQKAIQATQQLAKRQLTWLRRWPGVQQMKAIAL